MATVVIGLGVTGLSCARYLARVGRSFAVTDSRADPPGRQALLREVPDVRLALGALDPGLIEQARTLVVSPGVALDRPEIAAAAARGTEVIGDIELFARAARAPVVAITGANGKSTVTTLVGEMARAAGWAVAVGGNLGIAALDLLTTPDPALYVLELSSFQLATTTSLNAAAACVLNISEDHLDRHGTLADYALAKSRIYRGQGVMVVNRDDPLVSAMEIDGRTVYHTTLSIPTGEGFGMMPGEGGPWLARGATPILPLADLKIKGRHNAHNALAALALGTAVGLPLAAMTAALRRFPGLPHRCAWVAEGEGISWYDDSKGTNVGATEAALAGLLEVDQGARQGVLIAGGQAKGQDFAPLARAAAGRVRAAVVLGADGPAVAAALRATVPEVRVVASPLAVPAMTEAVALARALARPGDLVLLSPACASLDMFEGYGHRGRVFTECVADLLSANAAPHANHAAATTKARTAP